MSAAKLFAPVLGLVALGLLCASLVLGFALKPGSHACLASLVGCVLSALLSLAAQNAAERDLCCAKPYWAQ